MRARSPQEFAYITISGTITIGYSRIHVVIPWLAGILLGTFHQEEKMQRSMIEMN